MPIPNSSMLVFSTNDANHMSFFKDDHNNWINDHGKILEHTLKIFKGIFLTKHETSNWTHKNPLALSLLILILLLLIDLYKIMKLLKLFVCSSLLKRRDWMDCTLFYHKYWHTLKDSVFHYCHSIFETLTIREDLNNTYICLFLKYPNDNNLRNFCPIGLCSTIYKTITKIIVNRITSFLSSHFPQRKTCFGQCYHSSGNYISLH